MSSEPPREEPRWHASLAVIGALGLYVALPAHLSPGPSLALPVLEGVLLASLTIIAPRRRPGETAWLRGLAVALIALIAAANVGSLALLLEQLVGGAIQSGSQLLLSALLVWMTNVIVFALAFWELDRGGPHRRACADPGPADFLFPQMSMAERSNWRPAFVDYLYVAFTNASAFSPTDAMPLTPRAKLLMLSQSLASLVTVVLVTARAVNILH